MVYAVFGVCMSVSTLLSFWASRKSTSSRLKLFFLVASFVGVILAPILGGLLIVLFPDQRQSILAVARGEAWTAIGPIVAMAYVGMWRLPQIIAEQVSGVATSRNNETKTEAARPPFFIHDAL